jgi:methionyl-tRNA formyltransferase
VPIDARESAGTLEAKLAQAGARTLVGVLRSLHGRAGAAHAAAVDGITVAPKIRSDRSGDRLERRRRFDRSADPCVRPGAGRLRSIDGRLVKLWRPSPSRARRAPPAPCSTPTRRASS